MKNGRKWRILFAEDDMLLADTVDDMLRDEGFCVSHSPDGVAALERAAAKPFDVLLTDLRMPRLDGSALIRALRAENPALPVVVCSGYAPPEWLVNLQREGEGPLVMLAKPMRMRVLLDALRQVLGAANA